MKFHRRRTDTPAPPDEEPIVTTRSDPFPLDTLLRRQQFVIVSRVTGREPVWRRGQDVLAQRDALLVVEAETCEGRTA